MHFGAQLLTTIRSHLAWPVVIYNDLVKDDFPVAATGQMSLRQSGPTGRSGAIPTPRARPDTFICIFRRALQVRGRFAGVLPKLSTEINSNDFPVVPDDFPVVPDDFPVVPDDFPVPASAQAPSAVPNDFPPGSSFQSSASQPRDQASQLAQPPSPTPSSATPPRGGAGDEGPRHIHSIIGPARGTCHLQRSGGILRWRRAPYNDPVPPGAASCHLQPSGEILHFGAEPFTTVR